MSSSESVEVDMMHMKGYGSTVDVRSSQVDETPSLSDTSASSNNTSFVQGAASANMLGATDVDHGSSLPLSPNLRNSRNSRMSLSDHSIADRILALQKSASSTNGRSSFVATSTNDRFDHSQLGVGTKQNSSLLTLSNHSEINKEPPCDSLANSISSFSDTAFLSPEVNAGRKNVVLNSRQNGLPPVAPFEVETSPSTPTKNSLRGSDNGEKIPAASLERVVTAPTAGIPRQGSKGSIVRRWSALNPDHTQLPPAFRTAQRLSKSNHSPALTSPKQKINDARTLERVYPSPKQRVAPRKLKKNTWPPVATTDLTKMDISLLLAEGICLQEIVSLRRPTFENRVVESIEKALRIVRQDETERTENAGHTRSNESSFNNIAQPLLPSSSDVKKTFSVGNGGIVVSHENPSEDSQKKNGNSYRFDETETGKGESMSPTKAGRDSSKDMLSNMESRIKNIEQSNENDRTPSDISSVSESSDPMAKSETATKTKDEDENHPKKEQTLQRSLKVRWGGPTYYTIEARPLYYDDIFDDESDGHLPFAPLVDDRFGSLNGRSGDSSLAAPVRHRDVSATPPSRPRRTYDEWSDDESYVLEGTINESAERQEDIRKPGRGPDVWITPLQKSESWKVKRVWEIAAINAREKEHEVNEKDLLNKVKQLLGVPTEETLLGSYPDYNPANKLWCMKQIYSINGEIKHASDTLKMDENCLFSSVTKMVEGASKIQAESGTVVKESSGGIQRKENHDIIVSIAERRNIPITACETEKSDDLISKPLYQETAPKAEKPKDTKKKKKKKKKKDREEVSILSLLSPPPVNFLQDQP